MAMGWKPTRALIFTPLALLLFILGAVAQPHAALAAQGSTNGFAGQMPAIFNGQPVTININQLTTAESALLAHNGSVNKIYAIQDLDIPNPQFVPVINEIQGQGFNPLWDQFTYHFNSLPGVTPHQFQTEQQVLDAAAAGQITLTDTMEVYRCAVVGSGGK